MVSISCLFSALCFVLSNALGIAVIVDYLTHGDIETLKYRNLNSIYLAEQWHFKNSVLTMERISYVFNILAWMSLLLPILQLSWNLSRGGKRQLGIHAAIAALCITACSTEILSELFRIGASGAAHWLSVAFNLNYWGPDGDLDGIGWKALEVVWIVVEGMLSWVAAFEWICLFGILVLLYFSVGTQLEQHRVLPLWWARFGLFIAVLSFIDFFADLLRLEEYQTFAWAATIISIINTCIFLPAWLIQLSLRLGATNPSYAPDDDNWVSGMEAPAQATEQQSATPLEK